MSKKFFVTTPIYYINDVPHIGHAYATFAADILARYHRLLGDETFFLTGTDENAKKTVLAAEASGKDVGSYTDGMAKIWQETWKKLGVSNDDFIRTTQKRHVDFVKEFYKKIETNGDIYKGKYEGLYCVGHEAFLKEDDLDEKGFCPDHKTKPEKITEENYFFRLSKYQDKLLEFLEENTEFIQPKERFNEVYNFVKSGLQDISVSREKQQWGIPAPNDSSHVIYVWFDALINYLSADPKRWPADLHIIGKDISRFHAVIWPAMLWSAGYPLPKKIFAHGFFTIDGTKISKSLGNVIDPIELSQKYGADSLRYYLFKEIPFGNDGDFSFERFKEVYNSDLANGLGNLISRVAKLAETADVEISNPTKNLTFEESYKNGLDNLRFQQTLELIWAEITKLNQHIDKAEPWKLIKKDNQLAKRLILDHLVTPILGIQKLIAPFLPDTAEKIANQFKGPKIAGSTPLFPRI